MASVAVPIVFPDYEIAVATPAIPVDVPDWIPWVPDTVHIPASQHRLPYLGHAGILFFDRRGLTKYYEYGRYDRAAVGLVRRHLIPDLTFAGDARPAPAALRQTLSRISTLAGHGGRIAAAYIELADQGFNRMLSYAAARVRQNGNPARTPYDLFSHSCLHFMKAVAEAGGARMPDVLDPRPAGYIERVRAGFPDLDFSPSGGVSMSGAEP